MVDIVPPGEQYTDTLYKLQLFWKFQKHLKFAYVITIFTAYD